jgi:hypothetical protein
MKKLLCFLFAVGILIVLLVPTARAATIPKGQECILAAESPANVQLVRCDAIIAQETPGPSLMPARMEAWSRIGSAEYRVLTQTGRTALNSSLFIVSSQFIGAGIRTLSENGRAAPGDSLISCSEPICERRLLTLAEIGRAAPGDRVVCSKPRNH